MKPQDEAPVSGQLVLDCARMSVCMGDDNMAPNPGKVSVSAPLDPAALGRILCTEYLPFVAGSSHSWELQLNNVSFARVTFPSGDAPDVRALVEKCEFLAEGNTVWCKYNANA